MHPSVSNQQVLPAVPAAPAAAGPLPTVNALLFDGVFPLIGKAVKGLVVDTLNDLKLPPIAGVLNLLDIPLNLDLATLNVDLGVAFNVTVTPQPPNNVLIFAAVGIDLNVTLGLTPGDLPGASSLLGGLSAVSVEVVGLNVTVTASIYADQNGNFAINVTACLIVYDSISIHVNGPATGLTNVATNLLSALQKPLSQALTDTICAQLSLAFQNGSLSVFLGLSGSFQASNQPLTSWNITIINITGNSIQALLQGVSNNLNGQGASGISGIAQSLTSPDGLLGSLLGPQGLLGSLLGPDGLVQSLTNVVSGLLSGLTSSTGNGGSALGSLGSILRKRRQLPLSAITSALPALPAGLGQIVLDVTNLLSFIVKLVANLLNAILTLLSTGNLNLALSKLCPALSQQGYQLSLNFTAGAVSQPSNNALSVPISGVLSLVQNGAQALVLPLDTVIQLTSTVNGALAGLASGTVTPSTFNPPSSGGADNLVQCLTSVGNSVLTTVEQFLGNVTQALGIPLPFAANMGSPSGVIPNPASPGGLLSTANLIPAGGL